jgi:hypothetical protein
MAKEWLDNMMGNKISKEAMESQGTDKQDHFDRKVVAHPWVNDVLDLDPVTVEAEYREKLKQEAMTLGKTAALDDVIADGVTPEEVMNRDYKRDVSSLSDYALAEMLAEARGHKAQNTSEMFYELKEKAKAEVASSREKAEKALLELIPDATMLDWQKAFKQFTKDAVPAEVKEKDLFRTDVPEKAHDFEHPSEDKFKLPKDAEKAIPGNGREADERKEVTQEAGVLQKDIVAGTSKEASIKTASGECGAGDMILSDPTGLSCANCGAQKGPDGTVKHIKKNADNISIMDADKVAPQPLDENVIREAFKQMCEGGGEEVILDLLMQYMPVSEMQSMLNDFSDEGEWTPDEQQYEHAGVPMAVSFLKFQFNKIASGCPVCASMGKDLNNGQKEHMACEACGLTYAKASLETEAETDSHKLKRLRMKMKELNPIKDKSEYVDHLDQVDKLQQKKDEIKSHASKEEVIKKVAELSKTAEVKSPWAVTTDEQGNEVIARVDQPTNIKESEEEITTGTIKSASLKTAAAPVAPADKDEDKDKAPADAAPKAEPAVAPAAVVAPAAPVAAPAAAAVVPPAPAASTGDTTSPTRTNTETGGSSPGGASTGGVGSGIGGAGTGGAATGGASTGGAGTVNVTISGNSGTGSNSDGEKGEPITINISNVGGTTDAGDVASGDGPGSAGEGGKGEGSGGGGGGASPDEPRNFSTSKKDEKKDESDSSMFDKDDDADKKAPVDATPAAPAPAEEKASLKPLNFAASWIRDLLK